MKRLIIASLLLTTPALAQQQTAPTPSEQAMEIMYNQEVQAHKAVLTAAVQLRDQVAALTKEIADLKAKASEPAAK